MIPDSVTSIEDNAFAGCTSLEGIYFHGNAPIVGSDVFDNDTNATAYFLPGTIGWGSTFGGLPTTPWIQYIYTTNNGTITIDFYYGSASAVTIPSTIDGLTVTSIGDEAFYYCTNLISITIPKSVTNLGNIPFYNCFNLTGIYFQGDAPRFDWDLLGGWDMTVIYYLPGTMGWGTWFGGVPTTLWLPQVQTSDDSFGVRTNQFGFNINWASGQTVVVETCTNLDNPDWQPVQTNTLTTGSAYFSDPQWTNYPARFYRLCMP